MEKFNRGDEYLIFGDVCHALGIDYDARRAWQVAANEGSAGSVVRLATRAPDAEGSRATSSDWLGSLSPEPPTSSSELFEDLRAKLLLDSNAGDLDAANELGTLLAGEGRYEEAIAYHRKAATGGVVEAQNNLGADYRWLGHFDEAEKWYKLAAEAGYTRAQNNLGALYVGQGKPKLAFPWFERAAAAGNTDSVLNMANLLAGDGFVSDALNLIKPLAEDGLIPAINEAGVLCVRLGDMAQAKSFWLLGAKLGDASCFLNLGIFYREKNEHALAYEWLTLALHKEHPAAAEVIKTLQGESSDWVEEQVATYEAALAALESGRNEEALSLLFKSANMGWHEAQYDLGLLLVEEAGDLLDGDDELRQRGFEWLMKAANQGNQKAKDAVVQHFSPDVYGNLNP